MSFISSTPSFSNVLVSSVAMPIYSFKDPLRRRGSNQKLAEPIQGSGISTIDSTLTKPVKPLTKPVKPLTKPVKPPTSKKTPLQICVYINAHLAPFLNQNGQTTVYLSETAKMSEVLEKYFSAVNQQNGNKLRIYENYKTLDLSSASINISANCGSCGTITKDTRLNTINTSNNSTLWLTISFNSYSYLQIEGHQEIYMFLNTTPIVDAFKFIKSKTDKLDIAKFSFNGNPIPKTGIIRDVFQNFNQLQILTLANVVKATNTNRYGSIYLIRTREYTNQNTSVYKIGKTSNELGVRLGNYGKGGEVAFTIAVLNEKLDTTEIELIDIFKTKYEHKTEIGKEYFSGNMKDMIKTAYDYCYALI